jgi:hypothetical protein
MSVTKKEIMKKMMDLMGTKKRGSKRSKFANRERLRLMEDIINTKKRIDSLEAHLKAVLKKFRTKLS